MDYLIYNLTESHLQELADAALLSADERETAARRGGHYLLTRCLLRRELARRLGGTPEGIRFRYSEKGKPECDGIHFNLSHSGDYLAIAFDSAPVGIDIERVRPRPRLEALARRIMCPQQLAAFRERGCPLEEFHACWCATEAWVKQAAGSIWQAADYPLLCEHGSIRTLPTPGGGDSPQPTIQLFTPAPGYQGAVATFCPMSRDARS